MKDIGESTFGTKFVSYRLHLISAYYSKLPLRTTRLNRLIIESMNASIMKLVICTLAVVYLLFGFVIRTIYVIVFT